MKELNVIVHAPNCIMLATLEEIEEAVKEDTWTELTRSVDAVREARPRARVIMEDDVKVAT